MSEHKYEFGDPIKVLIVDEWKDGVYLSFHENEPDGLPHFVVVHDINSRVKATSHWTRPGHIRPRTATPRTGWRLPEPGDVIATTPEGQRLSSADEMTVYRFEPSDPYPIKAEWRIGGTRYEQCFGFDQVRLVRLHDAPPVPPAPAAKPGPSPALDDVTAARHLLDMVRGERPETDAIVLDAAAKILDRAAKTLAGGAA